MTEKEIDVSVKIEQLEAMNSILSDSVSQQGETIKHMKQIIIALIAGWLLSICFGFVAFVWYESQFEYEATTYEETLTTEGESAYINNVDGSQYNDSATHNEGGAN